MATKHDLDFLRVKNQSDDLYDEFFRMAKKLFFDFEVISRNGTDKRYHLVDIEFYLLSLWHQDFFIYGDDGQKRFGEWVKHRSGMDLAFGDEAEGIYAGILLRGIREVDGKREFTNGSLRVRATLSQMNHSVTSKILNKNLHLQRIEKSTDDQLILTSSRVGLTPKSLTEHHKRFVISHPEYDDNIVAKHEAFINRRYRFITDICPDNKFAEKEDIARKYFNAGIFTTDDIKKRYGYRVPNL